MADAGSLTLLRLLVSEVSGSFLEEPVGPINGTFQILPI